MDDRDRRYGGGQDRDRGERSGQGEGRRFGWGRDEDDDHRQRGGYFGGRDRDDDSRSSSYGGSSYGSSSYGGGRQDEWRGSEDRERGGGTYGRERGGMFGHERDEERGRSQGSYGRESGGYGRMGLGERGGWGSSHGMMERSERGQGQGSYGQGSYGQSGYGQSGWGGYGSSSGGGMGGYGQGGYGPSSGSTYGQGGYGTYGGSQSGYGSSGQGMGGMGGQGRMGGYGASTGQGGSHGRSESRDWGRERHMGEGGRGHQEQQEHEEGGFFHRMGEGIRNVFGMHDRGPFFGKGPKGYKRSDERIREECSEMIARQGWIDATDVDIKVQNGEVTLSGTVKEREHKRQLERMIEEISGVEDVRNEIRVKREAQGVTTAASGTTTTTASTGEEANRSGRNARTS
jgi:hypothetical protein